MSPSRIFASSLISVLLGTGSAYAGVIYNNGSPNQLDGLYADTSYQYTEAADNFTLSAGNNTITGVNWWGVCINNLGTCSASTTFTLYFYNDGGLVPGTQIGSSYAVGNANQTATGSSFGSNSEYEYSASIANLTLTAGTKYWLGITATTTTPNWGWEATGPDGVGDAVAFAGFWVVPSPGSGTIPVELAFNLTGPTTTSAVPEPGSLAILGAGILGVAGLRRRLKTRLT